MSYDHFVVSQTYTTSNLKSLNDKKLISHLEELSEKNV